LIYSVCTLSREETFQVAEFFQKQRPDFEPLKRTNPFQPSETANQFLFGPQDSGGNGMFVSGWGRV